MSNITVSVVIHILTTLIGALLGYFFNAVKKHKKREIDEYSAIKAILRSFITGRYYVYVSQGWIPQYEKENLAYLYTEYKKLGGNSYIDILYAELSTLPTEPPLGGER